MFVRKDVVFAVCLLVASALPLRGQVVSQGPLDGSAFSYEFFGCLGCPGSEWLNPGLAMLPDSQFASTPLQAYPNCFQSACYFARGLLVTDFGFSVPVNATVTGITVAIARKGYTTGAIRDSAVMLLKNGQPAGLSKVGPDPWPLMTQYRLYGDTTDTWGAVWTPADVNGSQFGVLVKPMNKSGAFDSASVDHVQVTVHYTVPVAISEWNGPRTGMYFDPAGQVLVVPAHAGPGRVRVFDLSGRGVWVADGMGVFSVTGLERGCYVAYYEGAGIAEALRFIVAR